MTDLINISMIHIIQLTYIYSNKGRLSFEFSRCEEMKKWRIVKEDSVSGPNSTYPSEERFPYWQHHCKTSLARCLCYSCGQSSLMSFSQGQHHTLLFLISPSVSLFSVNEISRTLSTSWNTTGLTPNVIGQLRQSLSFLFIFHSEYWALRQITKD